MPARRPLRPRPSRRWIRAVLAVPILIAVGPSPATSAGAPTPDQLGRLVDEIAELWADTDLLCLGETHGSVADALLREALVAHPDFPDLADVVLVEFVNPIHSEVVDRFVVEDLDVPRTRLRNLWRDAGDGGAWNELRAEAFLRAVRERNRALPPERRVRIVGAALPIDWSTVRTDDDLPSTDRGEWTDRLVRDEILEPGLRGLAIFGAGHCERRGMGFPARMEPHERSKIISIFAVDGPRGRAEAARRFGASGIPRLLRIRGRPAAESDAGALVFEGHRRAGARLGEVVDALVDWGPFDEESERPIDADFEPEFRRELERRRKLRRGALGPRGRTPSVRTVPFRARDEEDGVAPRPGRLGGRTDGGLRLHPRGIGDAPIPPGRSAPASLDLPIRPDLTLDRSDVLVRLTSGPLRRRFPGEALPEVGAEEAPRRATQGRNTTDDAIDQLDRRVGGADSDPRSLELPSGPQPARGNGRRPSPQPAGHEENRQQAERDGEPPR